ncbi:MAG: hypothetical protein VR78_18655 [Hoeflea sp. BRH_c9]|nr:MAG: hypothetical protein VR78_18655 [Hoeflea sp. BRH_c9]
MMEQSDRIIHMLYEAAAEGEGWFEAACAIGDEVGAGPVHMLLSSLETGQEYVNLLARGNPGFAAEYLDHYAPTDFRVPRVLAHRPGTYIDEREYVTAEEARSSPLHQDFLPRQEIFNICGSNMSHDGCIGWFGLSTRGPNHEFDDRQRAFLGVLSAHLFRAMKLHRNRLDLIAARDLATQTLDLLNTAIVLLTGSRVVDANSAFTRLLEDRFFLLRTDALTCAYPNQAARLSQYLGRTGDGGNEDCLVLRHPASGATYLVQSRDLFSPLAGRRRPLAHQTVSILKLDLEEEPELEDVMAFCGGYDISSAEAMVVRAVLSSQHLGEFAESRGIRLDTAHKQLKSAMRKIGASSQKKIFQAFERYRLISRRAG